MIKNPIRKLSRMRRFQSAANANDSPLLEPMTDSLTEQSIDFCGENQPELVDSKEHLRALFQDHKFNNNHTGQHPCDHKNQLNDLDTKITQCIEQNNQTHLKLDNFRKTVDFLLQKIGLDEESPSDHHAEANDDDLGENGIKTSSTFDVIDGKISKCIQSNKLTHLKVDNLQKSLNLILKNIENILMMNSEPSTGSSGGNEDYVGFRFPISTVSEINRLDQELQQNDDLMTKLIAKFTKVAGDSGNKSAKKVGVKIIERIISARLLTKFTWTGRTNGANNIKLPFITYSSIFYLCLQVISKADRSFDAIACENFLKNNVLKHSSMRLSRKFNRKVKRNKPKDETACMTSDKSVLESNVPEQKLDTEEHAFAEEIVDSKEDIKHLLDAQRETNNNPEGEENSFPQKCDHESKLNTLETKISYCLESNAEVHSKIDTMQETLNAILNKIAEHNGFDGVPVSVPAASSSLASDMIYDELELYNFPITSVSDLQDLNKRLSTRKTFEGKMIRKFISIAGHAKHISTQRFGLEVVESVISPQLLVKYSWTGRSKSIKPKMAFMKYKHVVNFFQRIVAKIDKSFTLKECEDFLRFTVFKYINMRAARTRRKVQVPLTEYYSDQEVDQEFSPMTSRLSVRDAQSIEPHENEQSYEYGHISAVELAEVNLGS